MSSERAVVVAPLGGRPAESATRVAEARARARGHAAGYAAGMRAAHAELERERAMLRAEHEAAVARERAALATAVALLSRAADALQARVVPVVAEAQETLFETAVELAELILGSELADGERSARAALARALNNTDASTVISVRMHPDDVEALRAAADPMPVPVVDDPAVPRGDAIAELPDGLLDASIGTAFERVRTVLNEGGA